jgi:hypothetical protein
MKRNTLPDHLNERFPEGWIESAVDDHVGGGVEHQEEMTEKSFTE